MTDAKPSFITLRGLHEAGEGIAFAVAELDPGRFWVLGRETTDAPFRRLHDAPIRREGAEALAADLAGALRHDLPGLAHADPDVRESASANVAMTMGPDDDRARQFDAAAALLPFLGDGPDAWQAALRIAEARPWCMPGRDYRAAVPAQCDLDSEIPF